MMATPAAGLLLRRVPLGTLLCLLAGVSGLGAQTTGTVRGQVVSEGMRSGLPAAVVEIVGLERPLAAAAGPSGAYELRDVPAGRRVLRATHIGHAPLEIEVVVPAGREIRLDLTLRVAPVQLDPVRVDAGRPTAGIDTVGAPGAELGIAGARALRSGPGIAELGLAEVVQNDPGQEPPDASDVLYVRGAAADLKLVYLDGAPVYAPFPLGGLADAFIPGVLRSATVFLGGAPARYDGGLSYIMDLRTRGVRDDGVHVAGSLDLLAGRAMVETPLAPGVALLAAGRTVHGAGAVESLPYGYREGLVRLDAALPGGARLHATGFANDEEVWLGQASGPESEIAWGNTAASIRLIAPFLGGDLEITAARGDYAASLPLEGRVTTIAEGSARRERIAADVSRRHGTTVVRYGASADRVRNRYHAALRDGAGVTAEVTGGSAGAYTDVAWQASERVAVRGGLRLDHFSAGGDLVLAPRIAVTLLATEHASVTAAAGRYHQYLRAPEATVLSPSVDSAGAGASPLSVGGASHVTVSLDQEMAEGVRFGVEGFFKSFEGIPSAPTSEASSSGVDLWLRRDAGRWTGWAGYSLAWVWSATGQAATDLFAGRHLISAGVGAPLAPGTRVEARLAYGSGLPYAAIRVGSPQPNSPGEFDYRSNDPETLSGSPDAAPLVPSPDRPYVRLDLSATHSLSRRVAGRVVRLESYLKLLNTLGRRDALFYRYDRHRAGELTALAVLPIVPVVGIEWRF